MKIAVTYDNGKIFQHFGKSQYMKIYETDENGEIQRVHIESMGKHSHHGIAGYIKEMGVETVICGGLVKVLSTLSKKPESPYTQATAETQIWQ